MVSARGHIGEPTLQAAIMDVSNLGAAVKVLGSYPMNPEISSARVGESLPPGSVTSDVLKEWVDRLVRPRTINLEGIFAILNNVAWTTIGPVLPEER